MPYFHCNHRQGSDTISYVAISVPKISITPENVYNIVLDLFKHLWIGPQRVGYKVCLRWQCKCSNTGNVYDIALNLFKFLLMHPIFSDPAIKLFDMSPTTNELLWTKVFGSGLNMSVKKFCLWQQCKCSIRLSKNASQVLFFVYTTYYMFL